MNTVKAVAKARNTAKLGVFPKSPERLLRTIGRRGKPVGSETNPGQNRNERDLMKNRSILDIPGSTDEFTSDSAKDIGMIF